MKLTPSEDEVHAQHQEKRKNLMHEIRDALIAGGDEENEAQI